MQLTLQTNYGVEIVEKGVYFKAVGVLYLGFCTLQS
jgi:hypothetical protein